MPSPQCLIHTYFCSDSTPTINIYYTNPRMLARKFATTLARFSSTSNNSLSLLDNSEKQTYAKLLQENVYINYKAYPALPHQDPHSSEYVHNQLDQYHDKTEVLEYNRVIDQFKHDLKVQRQVWDAIARLDRPYKRGIPGIDTNLNPDGPATPDLPDLGFPRRNLAKEIKWTFQNQDRFIANTPWNEKAPFKHIVEWEKERLNRPVTHDHNHGKGYKYDVAIKPEEKYEYVADRLGHPEFFGSPVDRLFKLQKDIYHPTYLDQPFVKMPSQFPSENLNFQQGEVIYENTRVLQWIRAFQLGNITALAYFGVFLPLNIAFKTNLTLDKADELFFSQQHLWSATSIDVARLFTPISTLGVFYIISATMKLITQVGGQYALKVSYSKDKELLFVKRVNNFGQVEQDVYETAHLEILPPRQRTGVKDLSSQDADGLWRITCLNSHRNILLYNNDAFWNKKLKAPFLQSFLNLWDKSYYGYNRKEQEEKDQKWRDQVFNSINQEALPGK